MVETRSRPGLMQLNVTSPSEHSLHKISDVRYVSKYRDTPGVSGYDTAMLVYRYFYKFRFCTI